MFVNSSSSLVMMTTPLLVLQGDIVTKIQFPQDWCDKSGDQPGCICDYQHDVVITYEGVDSFNDTLTDTEEKMSSIVDWWTEGVVLPIICSMGIIGRTQYTYLFSMTFSCSRTKTPLGSVQVLHQNVYGGGGV